MSEREPQSSEALSRANTAELEAIAKEITPEAVSDNGDAKQEQIETARAKIELHTETPAAFEEQAPKAPHHHITRLDKALAYRQTLKSLQQKLSPASRSFSKAIHQPTVEKTSEVLGQTILRPSVTLGATLTAIIVEGSLYLTAKHYGFALRGSEILLLLLLGAIIGLIIEGLAKLLHRRKLR